MGLFSALVHVVKNDIESSKDDSCHVCEQIVPEHSFKLMVDDIREVTIREGEIVTLENSNDKAINHIEL